MVTFSYPKNTKKVFFYLRKTYAVLIDINTWGLIYKRWAKKIAETGMECAYASCIANVGTIEKCGKGAHSYAKFFRHKKQRHPMVTSPNKVHSSKRK